MKRFRWWASAALGASIAFACGGRTRPDDEVAAVGSGLDAGDEGAAATPVNCSLSVLTASPATTLLSVPMGRDPQADLELPPGLTVAATPAGDRFLVALTPTGVLSNSPSTGGSVTVVKLTSVGATASPPIAVPQGQAAFDGQDLVLLFDSLNAGIGVQRVSTEGSLVGAQVTGLGGSVSAILSESHAGAGGAVTTPLGAAVTWQDVAADGGYFTHASAIGPDLSMVEDEHLSDAPSVGLGVLDGRTFAMSCASGNGPPTLVDLGWSGEPASTFVVERGTCPFVDNGTSSGLQGIAPPLVSTGGRLGLILSSADDGFEHLWPHKGTPGQGFTPTVPLPDYLAAVAADSCGRVVVLSTSGLLVFPTPRSGGGPQPPALLATSGTPGASPLTLDTAVMNAAVAPTPGGFAVFWLEPSAPNGRTETLKMTTLTWE